jgi:hypothetical protein
LDGKMTEATDADYANAISWFGGADESTVHSASGTLEWGSVLG